MKRKDIVPALLIGVGLMTLSGCGGAKGTVSPPVTESSVSESINTTEENMSKEKNYDKLITVDFENRVTTNNGEFVIVIICNNPFTNEGSTKKCVELTQIVTDYLS